MIYNLAEALLDEGDTICFAVPYWTSYLDIAEIVNAKIDLLPCPATPGLQDDARAARRRAGEEAEGLPVQQPVQPDGHGLHEGRNLGARRRRWRSTRTPGSITDDIYNRMVFDGVGYHNFVHARPELRDRVIFIDSLSKTYGMPGWRVGFMAGPEVVAQAVATMNSNHITNIPEIVTAAAIAALSGPQDVPTAKNAEFQAKRDQVLAVLAQIPGVVCPRPQGAFYVFPDISVAFGKTHGPTGLAIGNDVDFCNALLEAKGVACVPGSAFGEPRALRISYTCPTPQLAPGLRAHPGVLRGTAVTCTDRATHRIRFPGVTQ